MGSLSSDELLRMHRCTEAIRYLSAAGLIPTKQPEEVGAPDGLLLLLISCRRSKSNCRCPFASSPLRKWHG